ncbi:MAG: Hint domain-containing protein, partial [Paracoccaceae bacterium]
VGRDGFELSATTTGANVAEQINIVIAIDTSGSTGASSGTDFNGDGTTETILQAQLIGAQDLFDAYVDAGYDPSEISISLVDFSGSATVVGSFTLDQSTEYTAALQTINSNGPGGGTNFDDALDKSIDAFNAVGATTSETNVLVFMSDGFPTSGGLDFDNELQTLEDDFGTAISGIGLGPNSSLTVLNQIDNTGGAVQVNSGQELTDFIVQPLTDIDFLRFEIEIEGIDENGDPITQTITLNEGDPEVIVTPTGWSFDCLPISEEFQVGSELMVTVNSVFGEDPGNPGSGEQVVTTEHTLNIVVCFVAGTMILTPNGEVEIETLDVGDRVVTRDHGVQKIRWIGATTFPGSYVAANPHLRPVLIRENAIAKGVPDRDLRVSRQHRILVRDWRAEVMFGDPDGVLTPAFTLCNDHSIVEERPDAPVTYLHMAFDQHEVVYANGVEAESFQPAERTVSGLSAPHREELFEIFPELREGAEPAYGSARKELRGKEAAALLPGRPAA